MVSLYLVNVRLRGRVTVPRVTVRGEKGHGHGAGFCELTEAPEAGPSVRSLWGHITGDPRLTACPGPALRRRE